MIECPHCQAKNRIGAKFCKECAGDLPLSPKTTVPLSPKATVPLTKERLSSLDIPTQPIRNPETKPIQPAIETQDQPIPEENDIRSRPPGAIFGDQLLYKSLVFSDETQLRYLVTPIDGPTDHNFQVCTNNDCRVLYCARDQETQKYCTDCGSALNNMTGDLALTETLSPTPESLKAITAKKLSHHSIRAPLLVFEEPLDGGIRHCVAMPVVSSFGSLPATSQGLRWGVDLAYGMDYLHDNGITFEGRIAEDCLAMDGDRAVWVNFTCDQLLVDNEVIDRSADARSLAGLVFQWLTGRSEYEPDPNLGLEESRVLEKALTGPGFATAAEFAGELEDALEQIASQRPIDYRLGRRTNVGMLRDLNQDSMLTIELNRTQQSISQPLGLYVVADGMGGHTAGEIASGTIVNSMSEKILREFMPSQIVQGGTNNHLEWLTEAVMEANTAVYNLRNSSETDMGSTLVAAILQGNQAYIAHVGDSRAYLVNLKGIQRLTKDHSLVERLVATNQITPEEARIHPQRNVIYRTIGDKKTVDVETSTQTLRVDDYLLLCSDGLSGMLDDQTIQGIILEIQTPQEACDRLVDAANAAGGDDNITVIIIRLVQV